MTEGNSTPAGASDDMGTTSIFNVSFPVLLPLIQDEWPAVDDGALLQTEGDYDLVVALIATETEQTKTLIKKQLGEICQIAEADRAKPDPEQREVARLRKTVERLQQRSNEISKYLREEMLTNAKGQVEQHPLVALMVAIGLGFVVGFILRGAGRER